MKPKPVIETRRDWEIVDTLAPQYIKQTDWNPDVEFGLKERAIRNYRWPYVKAIWETLKGQYPHLIEVSTIRRIHKNMDSIFYDKQKNLKDKRPTRKDYTTRSFAKIHTDRVTEMCFFIGLTWGKVAEKCMKYGQLVDDRYWVTDLLQEDDEGLIKYHSDKPILWLMKTFGKTREEIEKILNDTGKS